MYIYIYTYNLIAHFIVQNLKSNLEYSILKDNGQPTCLFISMWMNAFD